jgi:hypothetical protein
MKVCPAKAGAFSGKQTRQALAGVRKAARENKEMKFTSLLHHLTVDLLRESFYSLKRRAAPGGLTVMAIRQLSPTLSDKIIA